MSSEAEPKRRLALVALIAAWVLLIGLVAAGGGYVFLSGEDPLTAGPEGPTEDAGQPAESARKKGEDVAEQSGEQDDADAAGEAAQASGETIALKLESMPAESEATNLPLNGSAAEPAGTDAAEPAVSDVGPQDTDTGAQQAALQSDEPPAWKQFAIPFEAEGSNPRIAVVLSGLGLSAAATEAAIKQLPPAITLSFSPYARLLDQWIALARVNGHEVMLDLPMEPVTFPEDDPGPHALLTVLDEAQNLKRLDWLLDRGNSFVGVASVMGSRFLASEKHLSPVLAELKARGLLFLDNRTSEESAAGGLAKKLALPYVVNDRTLDAAQASRAAVDSRLSEIERLARENGYAVALAQPYPATIERLRDWTVEIEARGLVLAPITALAAGN